MSHWVVFSAPNLGTLSEKHKVQEELCSICQKPTRSIVSRAGYRFDSYQGEPFFGGPAFGSRANTYFASDRFVEKMVREKVTGFEIAIGIGERAADFDSITGISPPKNLLALNVNASIFRAHLDRIFVARPINCDQHPELEATDQRKRELLAPPSFYEATSLPASDFARLQEVSSPDLGPLIISKRVRTLLDRLAAEEPESLAKDLVLVPLRVG